MALTDENINRMLQQLADVEQNQQICAEQNDEIKEEVGTLSKSFDSLSVDLVALAASQKADDETRVSAATTWKVVKTIGLVASVILLPLFGWLGKEAYAHYMGQVERIDDVQSDTSENAQVIETHSGVIGHEPLRQRVQQNRESIATIETQLDTIGQQQTKIHQSQERIEHAINRRPR